MLLEMPITSGAVSVSLDGDQVNRDRNKYKIETNVPMLESASCETTENNVSADALGGTSGSLSQAAW
jgi:hypothetical protein